MALTWLPKIKSILLCVVCALWLPLIPFMLLNNFRVPTGWFGLLLWLSLWGVMLSIINAIYTDQLIDVTSNIAVSTSGARSLTFGNRWHLWSESTNVLAGMGLSVSWMIPLSGVILSWIGLRAMSSSAVEQRFNRAAGDISRLEDVGVAGNLQYENTKVISQGGRPEEQANANAFRYARDVAAPAYSYDLFGQSGAMNPMVNKSSSDQALSGMTGNPYTGVQGQSMDMKTGLMNAGFTASDAAMLEQFMSDYQGGFSRGMNTSLSEMTKTSAKSEQANHVRLSGQESFRNATGYDITTAHQWAKDLGYGADWIHSEEARQGVSLAMGIKDHLIHQYGFSDTESTHMTSRYMHIGHGKLGVGFGGGYEDPSSMTPPDSPNAKGPGVTGKGFKKGLDVGAAYQIATQIANEEGRGTGKSAKIDKRHDAHTGLDNSAQRSSSDAGSVRLGERSSLGESKRMGSTASRVYSALQTYEQSITESEALSREAMESRAIQHMFAANAGYNLVYRMFGFHIRKGDVEGISEANVNRNLPQAIASFRSAWEDDRKRNRLMKEYAMNQGVLSFEGASAFDSDGMATSPRKLIVQKGVQLSNGETLLEDRNSEAFELIETSGDALLNGQSNILNALKNAGVEMSANAGDADLFEDVFNIVANGGADPKRMQESLEDRLKGISDTTQLQVAAIAAKHAYKQRMTNPFEAAIETLDQYTTAIQNALGNVFRNIPEGHYQTHPGIIGTVTPEQIKLEDLENKNGDRFENFGIGAVSQITNAGENRFDPELDGKHSVNPDRMSAPFSDDSMEIGNRFDALREQILEFKDKGLLGDDALETLTRNMQIIESVLGGKNDETINQVLGLGVEAIRENARSMNEFMDRHSVKVAVSEVGLQPFQKDGDNPGVDNRHTKGMQWKKP